MRFFLLPVFLVIASIGCMQSGPAGPQAPSQFKILVFSKTTGFRHDSIPDGIAMIRNLGAQNQFAVDTSEDASVFSDANLANYKAVVFLNTSGDVLNDMQKSAFQRYIQASGGFVGIHSASDTEHGWPWYGGLVGAYFLDHPAVQPATIKIEDATNPSTSFLGTAWRRTDEWYNFATNPRGTVHVLAALDESTYSGGSMGTDHPINWCQTYQGGRSWYTAGGHTMEAYAEPLFQQHVLGGIQYAAGTVPGNCQP